MNYQDLAIMLEEIPDGELVKIKLISGELFELSNCETVDESIYGNVTTIVADIHQKLTGDMRFHTAGTKLQFNSSDIAIVQMVETGKVLYEAST